MRKPRIIMASFLFSLFFAGVTNAQECTIREETRQIKTYPFADPDPVPILVKKPHIYPYFDFEKFSATGRPQPWKVVVMENPYIRVLVLPEVGGKVYGAIEKSTGRAFVYLNHVLKFRQIALRGPWTSGGIEFNFGIVGHTPAAATPVDYMLKKNPDGSVSCVVGTIDLPSRTQWRVTITLPKDKAYFQTRALWYNPSPLHQSYYVWLNDAVKAGDDLQYFYPGRYVVPHSESISLQPWPIDRKGRDLSWYKNNNFGGSKSHFILGEYQNFYGGYWHNSKFGFGHWAHYDDMPGKKMWIWALSRSGAIWEHLLTDTDGQYSEPQAGRLFSQVDHEFFTPYTADTWREIWFPFKGIGGLVQASSYAALNVNRQTDSLTIAVCALQKINENLIVAIHKQEVARQHLSLQPMQVFRKTIATGARKGTLEISIGDKLFYTDDAGKIEIHRPIVYHSLDDGTTEETYLAGERYEKQRHYHLAMQKYLACLKQDSLHLPALTRLAELYYRRAQYEKALGYASRALAISMYDPDANYIYGIISRASGDLVDAKEALGWAARSLKYRSNAYCQMSEIAIRERNYNLATDYARRALNFNKYNLRAYQTQAIAWRKLGDTQKAESTLAKLLDIDPLNHLARFEHYLLQPNEKNLDNFTSMIRNELPHESYLEMAIFYTSLGLEEEARNILEQAPAYATVYYWLAYLSRNDPAASQHYLQEALQCSPRLVFPFRQETIPVLQWASEQRPGAWKTNYYLGLIYWAIGREQKARERLEACNDAPDYAPFYLALGYLEKKMQANRTLSLYQKALSIDRKDWRPWHYNIALYQELNRQKEALNLARQAIRIFPNEFHIQMDYASSLLYTHHERDCLNTLKKMKVLPYEGAADAHHLFVWANINLAMAHIQKREFKRAIKYLEQSKTYPEHLGTGQPFDPDNRMQDYLEMVCYRKLRNGAKAENIRKKIYDYTIRNWIEWGSQHFFGALVLRESGENSKAEKLLQDWQRRYPHNRTVQWYLAKFYGDKKTAQEIGKEKMGNPGFGFMSQVVGVFEK